MWLKPVEVNRSTVVFLRQHAAVLKKEGLSYCRTRNLLLWMLRQDVTLIDATAGRQWYEAFESNRSTVSVDMPRGTRNLLNKVPLPASAQRSDNTIMGFLLDGLATGFVRVEPELPPLIPHSFDFTLFRFSLPATKAFRFLINDQLKTYVEIATELSSLEYTSTVGRPIQLSAREHMTRVALPKEPMGRLAILAAQFDVRGVYQTPHLPNLALEAILNGYLLPNNSDYAKVLSNEGR